MPDGRTNGRRRCTIALESWLSCFGEAGGGYASLSDGGSAACFPVLVDLFTAWTIANDAVVVTRLVLLGHVVVVILHVNELVASVTREGFQLVVGDLGVVNGHSASPIHKRRNQAVNPVEQGQ